MADASLVAYEAATKDTYTEDVLYEQLQQDDDVLSWIETTRKFRVGNEARTPLHTTRNGGFTMLPAGGGTLNTAGHQGSERAVWQYKNAHAQIAIEGETIDGTSDNAVAVAEVLNTEVSGALNDMRQQLVRQIFGDGSGVIAICGTTSSDNEIVLDPVSGFNAIERGWLFEGAQIDIGTAADFDNVFTGRNITAVNEDEDAPTITVDGSAVSTTATTHRIAYKGSRGNSTSNEMNGLKNLVSTGDSVGGLDGATKTAWNAASVDTNGGTLRPLTLKLMYKQQRKVMQKTNKGVDTVLSSFEQQEEFYNLLQAQAQFTGDNGLEAGNVTKAKFAGMAVKGELHCPNEDMYFLTKQHLLQLAAGKPYWQNRITGGNILSWIQGTDSYGAKITYRLNLGTRKRNSAARLGDLR